MKHRNKDSGFQEDTSTKKKKRKNNRPQTNAKQVSKKRLPDELEEQKRDPRRKNRTDNWKRVGLNYLQNGKGLKS
jgi:hypothetical protein